MSSQAICVRVCPEAERAVALKQLHDGLSPEQQPALVQAIDSSQGESGFSGLFVVSSGKEPQAVLWVQQTPGKTAVVWPPDQTHFAARELMRAIPPFLDQQQVALAQLLVHPDAPCDIDLLESAQLHHLATLAYLVVERSHLPSSGATMNADSPLEFEPRAEESPERLGPLLERTYQGSLDCPTLDGVRDYPDVLEGYAAQGQADSRCWFFVRYQAQDVGALLLAEYPDASTWELIYMGILPSVRGQGFGWQIVQHALWQASQRGAERVVLAVDEANHPALAMYRRAGFVPWDRRKVYARLKPAL